MIHVTCLLVQEGQAHASVAVDSDLRGVLHVFIVTSRHPRSRLQTARAHDACSEKTKMIKWILKLSAAVPQRTDADLRCC